MRLDAASPGSPARLCGELGFPTRSFFPSPSTPVEGNAFAGCRLSQDPKGAVGGGGSQEDVGLTPLGLLPYGLHFSEEESDSRSGENSQQRPQSQSSAAAAQFHSEGAAERVPGSSSGESWILDFLDTCSTAVDSERAQSRFQESPPPERASVSQVLPSLSVPHLAASERRTVFGRGEQNASLLAQIPTVYATVSRLPPDAACSSSAAPSSPHEATMPEDNSASTSRVTQQQQQQQPHHQQQQQQRQQQQQQNGPSPQRGDYRQSFPAPTPAPPAGFHVRESVATQEFVVTSQSQVQRRVEVREEWSEAGSGQGSRQPVQSYSDLRNSIPAISHSGSQYTFQRTQPLTQGHMATPPISAARPPLYTSYISNEVVDPNQYPTPFAQPSASPRPALGSPTSFPQFPSQLFCEPRFEEKVIHVPRIDYVDKVVEVDQVEYREKFVEVPQIVLQEKVVHRPKIIYEERIRNVPVPQVVEVLKDKVEVMYKHKYVEVPQVLLQDEIIEQPVVQVVEKIVQVPKPVYVEKIVEVPRTEHRQVYTERFVEVPVVQTVYQEKLVPVPQKKYNYLPPPPVYVPVEKRIPRIVKVPQPQDVYEVVEKPVYVTKYVDKPYPVFTERVVEEPYAVEVRREVPRPVPYPVYREVRRPVVQQSDVLIQSQGGLMRLEDFARQHNIVNWNTAGGESHAPHFSAQAPVSAASASQAAFSSVQEKAPMRICGPALSSSGTSSFQYSNYNSLPMHNSSGWPAVPSPVASFSSSSSSSSQAVHATPTPLASPRPLPQLPLLNTQREDAFSALFARKSFLPERQSELQPVLSTRPAPPPTPINNSSINNNNVHSNNINKDREARLPCINWGERERCSNRGEGSAQSQTGLVNKRFEEQAQYLQQQVLQTPRGEDTKPRQLQTPKRVEVFVQQMKTPSPSGFVDAYPLSPR